MKNQVVIKPAAATELWRESQPPVLFHFLSPGDWIMGIITNSNSGEHLQNGFYDIYKKSQNFSMGSLYN